MPFKIIGGGSFTMPLLGRRSIGGGGGGGGGGGFAFADLSGAYVEDFPFPTGYTVAYGLDEVDGYVWLASLGSGTTDHMLQIDPVTKELVKGYPSPTGGARVICAGVDGTFWVKPHSGDTTRIDPSDGSELQRVSFGGTVNRGLCWRPDVDPDRIWYGATSTQLYSYSLATGANLDTYAIPFSAMFDAYSDFAWDQASGTWLFLDPHGAGDDYIHQIDPSTGDLVRSLQIDPEGAGGGVSYQAMAIVGSRIWLSNSNNDFVTIIE